MHVTVKLFNQLRRYAPTSGPAFSLQLPDGASVDDLLTKLKIPLTEQRTILVNGRRVNEDALVEPDDVVVLMSPIEGG